MFLKLSINIFTDIFNPHYLLGIPLLRSCTV